MSFDRFLADLKQQAVADGVSQRALTDAAPYPSSTTKASSTATAASACSARCSLNLHGTGRPMARQRMRRRESQMHAAAFNRAEKEYGVPPAVIAAFWGLESSFGAELGKLHTLPSLVSLAYDCRRSETKPFFAVILNGVKDLKEPPENTRFFPSLRMTKWGHWRVLPEAQKLFPPTKS